MIQQTHRPARPLATVVEPHVRPAGPADRELLGELIAQLSPASAYSRFLTGVSGPPSGKLLRALLPEAPAGGALLGFVDGELAGHGLWVRTTDPSVAEIALVVADRHQRRGIGTALAAALVDELVAHGVEDIEVFSISNNRAVARMVAHAAPDARRELDGPTATWTFPARRRGGVLSRSA
ncbi:MAG TPA: GNAT family N-acetyltransferase [Nocardioides sp.]|uniref:GNAT family N-acetyltransferase n=1 Tax=Nocardioides sp. TaxID=35761 RepID=UPI002E2EBAB2|nr:GNAT family N-acetyltransferase [Nocardioides sp.]HEX5090460.1 GNAT family N-acetyltransferase [Nocardioides sp.]